MPSKSPKPSFEVPKEDIWGFMFERKNLPFPEDKVMLSSTETDRTYTYAGIKSTAIDFGKGLKSIWEWQKGVSSITHKPYSSYASPWRVQGQVH